MTGVGMRVGMGVAAVLAAAGGFVLGRALTGPEPVPRNDRAPVDAERAAEIMSLGLYANHEGAITQEEADCAGRTTTDAIGRERLVELGLGGINPYGGFSLAELVVDEEESFMEAFLGCIPDERFAAYRHSSIEGTPGLDRDQAGCVADAEIAAVGVTRLRELLVAVSLEPGTTLADVAEPAEQPALAAVAADCGVADVLTTAIVP